MGLRCQKCEKPATFHITELTGDTPEELHLCEDCAKIYLTKDDTSLEPASPTLAGVLAQQLKIGQTAKDLQRLDQQACPACGITFYEFRQQGGLGCPHDYSCFASDLEPLIINIHGEMNHVGKRPTRVHASTDERTELIRLRRDMQDAVDQEDYERASELRDQIQTFEQQQGE
jgi:protein arginine kinase activator